MQRRETNVRHCGKRSCLMSHHVKTGRMRKRTFKMPSLTSHAADRMGSHTNKKQGTSEEEHRWEEERGNEIWRRLMTDPTL